MRQQLLSLLAGRKGHFRLESGHHGDLWLDLELLCLDPKRARPLAVELAERLSQLKIEAVCGPLIEGAFVGLMVAMELGIEFSYSERVKGADNDALYPVSYRIPAALRPKLRDKRVAIVNDVINAGSALRGTYRDLEASGAQPVAVGTLLVLGTLAATFAADNGLILETLASLPNVLWTPAECPLCAAGVPLGNPAGNAQVL